MERGVKRTISALVLGGFVLGATAFFGAPEASAKPYYWKNGRKVYKTTLPGGDWDGDGIRNYQDRDKDGDGRADHRDGHDYSGTSWGRNGRGNYGTQYRYDDRYRDDDRYRYNSRDRDRDGVRNRRDDRPRNPRRR